MQSTPNYFLGIFDAGDKLNSALSASVLQNRFSIIDTQLFGLYNILGTCGVIYGWIVADNGYSTSTGISVSISSGIGISLAVACLSLQTDSIAFISPNSVSYIYASRSGISLINRQVSFFSNNSIIDSNNSKVILLAKITTGTNNIILIDNTVRDNINFLQIVQNDIKLHKHRGLPNSPSKIDLQNLVKNSLDGARISELDASVISYGKFNLKNIPSISHNDLKDKGILTHPQIDTLLNSYSNLNQLLLGLVAAVNRMKQSIYLKYSDPTANNNLINEIDFIPGISNSSIIDMDNTTAYVDTINKVISGPDFSYPDTYFYLNNFRLLSPVKSAIVTSTKSQNEGIVFGLNFSNSVTFSQYTEIKLNQITKFDNNLSSYLRVGIKLSNNTSVNYPSQYSAFSLYNNNVIFLFQNTGVLDNFNFIIEFYSNQSKTNLIFTADTSISALGWSYNGIPLVAGGLSTLMTLGGITIPTSDSVIIKFDPNQINQIDCGVYYYVKISQKNTINTVVLDSTDVFIQYCALTFDTYFNYHFTNTLLSNLNHHFRIRLYSNPLRTILINTYYSLDDQSNWYINGSTIAPGGFMVDSLTTVQVTYSPSSTGLSFGTEYFCIVDQFNGSDFVGENNNYTFVYRDIASSAYPFNPTVSNFAIMLELLDGQFMSLNND